MKKQSILLISFLLLIISSCTKDSLSGTPYHSTYYKSGIIPAGAFRVFASTGEIMDQLLVDRFNEADSSQFSRYIGFFGNEPGHMDSIIFTDEQDASVVEYSNHDSCKVNYQNGKFVLTQVAIKTGYSDGELFTSNIPYFLGQIKPEVFTEYLFSSVRGNYVFGFTARFKYVLERRGAKMGAPLIQFQTHHDIINSTSFGIVNNILQDDFYKNITAGDTVTLRQYQVLYEKK